MSGFHGWMTMPGWRSEDWPDCRLSSFPPTSAFAIAERLVMAKVASDVEVFAIEHGLWALPFGDRPAGSAVQARRVSAPFIAVEAGHRPARCSSGAGVPAPMAGRAAVRGRRAAGGGGRLQARVRPPSAGGWRAGRRIAGLAQSPATAVAS